MTELTAMTDIIGSEQNADIAVEFGFSAPSGATWSAGDPVGRQIPPQVFALTFLGIDVTIDGFLTDPKGSCLLYTSPSPRD